MDIHHQIDKALATHNLRSLDEVLVTGLSFEPLNGYFLYLHGLSEFLSSASVESLLTFIEIMGVFENPAAELAQSVLKNRFGRKAEVRRFIGTYKPYPWKTPVFTAAGTTGLAEYDRILRTGDLRLATDWLENLLLQCPDDTEVIQQSRMHSLLSKASYSKLLQTGRIFCGPSLAYWGQALKALIFASVRYPARAASKDFSQILDRVLKLCAVESGLAGEPEVAAIISFINESSAARSETFRRYS
jgi:hypothetical protein